MDGLSKEMCIASYLFLKKVFQIGRKSGWLFLALYVKQCQFSLKVFRAGSFRPDTPMSVAISLNRSGLPRIIPKFHRLIIIKDCGTRADKIIQVYLSFFSMYSFIMLSKRMSSSLFESITKPIGDIPRLETWMLKPHIKSLFSRYVPGISSIPLNQGMRWLPLWSTLPTYATWKRVMDKYYPEEKQFGRMRSPILVQLMELMAFRSLSKAARGEQFIQGVLFPKRVRYAFDSRNKMFSESDLETFERTVGPQSGSSNISDR